MYTLFLILIVLAAILMIGIVLIQESKGGGLASNFSSSNQIMGVRKTTDFIEKATWGLAIALVVFSIICAYTAPESTASKSVMENQTEAPQANPNNQQGFGAGQTTTPAAQQQGAQAPASQQQGAQGAATQQTPAKSK